MANFSDQTNKELADLLVRLRNNPKTSKVVAKAIRQIDPSVKFNDLEIDDLRAEVRGEIEDMKTEKERDEIMRRMASERRKIAERYKNEDGTINEQHMGAIEAIMKQKGIYDYDVASTYYAAQLPAPEPRPQARMGAHWQAPKLDGLFENPLQWSRNEAFKAIDELSQARKN